MNATSHAAALSLLTLVAWDPQPGGSPKFEDYPAVLEAVRNPAPLRFSDPRSRQYAGQLRLAAQDGINFAGHYILGQWGCGASCVMAAAIDAKTGRVIHLPFTVSNWPLDVVEPLQFHQNSRLLIVRGSRNERDDGIYYYEFTGRGFALVGSEKAPRK